MSSPQVDLIYGIHPVLEALAGADVADRAVELLVQEGAQGRGPKQAHAIARQLGIKVRAVPAQSLQRLCGEQANHQGVALRIGEFSYADPEALLLQLAAPAPAPASAQDQRPLRRVLVLDQVQDPRNLGALLRSAVAFGFGAVFIPRDRAAPVSGEAIKASAGAALKVPVARVTNIARTIDSLKESGFWVYGAAGDDGKALPEQTDWRRDVALIMGSEGEGLRALTRKQCDVLVRIPQRPEVESLNVSVAGSLLMYAAYRVTI
jgi:23S rRNA (guanosine2251-2'-O)-methyltransferase